jgi:ferric-dicitrate binding protein FerR (iron transport regulator)
MDPIGRWSSVAAVLLICLTATLFYIQHRGRTIQTPKFSNTRGILPPGGNKAILTLADGSTIQLDSSRNGHLAFQGETNIVKADGLLTYKGTATTEILFNTISTPRGGQYAVTLADGTKIWLNAASSLKYPTAFTGTSRSVELTGEAYFEVAGDKSKPFTVRLNGMDVQVLGTKFNIKAYQDDASIRTTLVDGAVRLTASGAGEALLKPGQQGVWSQQLPRFMVREVNTNNEVAWRNGYFAFDNENIHDIMKDLSRWYNIDIEFRNNLIEKKFGGTVSRYQNAEEVLEILELTGSVHFSIKDKKIIVMP